MVSWCECDGSPVRPAPCLLTNLPSIPLRPPDPGTVRGEILQPSSVLTLPAESCAIVRAWVWPVAFLRVHWMDYTASLSLRGWEGEKGVLLCWGFGAWLMNVREIWDCLGEMRGAGYICIRSSKSLMPPRVQAFRNSQISQEFTVLFITCAWVHIMFSPQSVLICNSLGYSGIQGN